MWLLKSREPEQEQQQGTSDNESEGDAASEEQKTENDLASKFAPEDIEHLQSLSVCSILIFFWGGLLLDVDNFF